MMLNGIGMIAAASRASAMEYSKPPRSATWRAAALGIALALLSHDAFAHNLPQPLAQALARHRIPASAVSFEVRALNADDSGDSDSLIRFNADTPRNPASAIKLLTTLAALELLGPHHRWETRYFADGAIVDGVLHGDLIVRGGGDPFLTVEHLLGHILALRQRGLTRIAGDLVIDNSLFAIAPEDRAAFDGEPQRLYNVGPDAALLNLSATTLVIEPTGDRIRVTVEPPLDGLRVVGRIRARDGKCISRNAGWRYRFAHDGDAPVLRVSGDYRRKCGSHSVSRSFLPNTEYAQRLFAALWKMMGGELDGGYRVGVAPDDAHLLLTRESDSLADIVTGINKFSNNAMARQLVLTLAAAANADDDDAQPATVADGLREIRAWLDASGIQMPALVIENGSGLSRRARATASGLSALLARAWRSTYRAEFVSSLPLAALDGTLRKRLPDSPLRGRARIKTGLIDGVRSMAGYVHARDGKHYSVVLLIDSSRIGFANGNAVQDAALRWVYQR